MKLRFHSALFGATSVFVLATTAFAQTPAASASAATEGLEPIVVSGSRVISDAANSPTPLTIVTADQLEATTPTDIADALNKLPEFFGSTSPRTINNPSSNAAGNTLNLRNFGAQRTLVLLDGDRVAPSNSNGTVDVDILPNMLMSRVDIVTGGASAVYGSDAITGVVNYILDKNFNGVKYEANTGRSNFGDAPMSSIGVAMGTDLFGGRGHIEGSLHYFHQGGVAMAARPNGNNGQAWIVVGNGTAASPYSYIQYGRESVQGFGGLVTCNCAANNMQFVSPGVLGPFNPGQPTSGYGVSNGGDGGYDSVGDYQAEQRTSESFVRFSYDLTDTTTFYVQGTADEATNSAVFANAETTYPYGYGVSTFYTNNPFLSPAVQAQLNSGNPGNTFTLTSQPEFLGGPGGGPAPNYTEESIDRNLGVTLGVYGTLLGKYDWRLHYTHGDSRQRETEPNNMNLQKMYAASDAVVNSSGNIVCNVSTTQYANLYPGCVPFNVFGEGSLTRQQFNYTHQATYYVETNTLDNVSGNIAGPIFDLPAGPVKAALSGEARWLSLDVNSNSPATAQVNCTGLRNCSPAQLFDDNTVSPASAKESVWEFAGEVNVPILANLPLIQSLSADLAGRVTTYSVSGRVETWKAGLDYHVNDSVRFRGTASQDIRAPTLTDLFQPKTVGGFGYYDALTGSSGTLTLHTQGNSQLKPEVARTYSEGVVLTPVFVPHLTLSVDLYKIGIDNAITAINPGVDSNVQKTCTESGGTSDLCALIVRPISTLNTSPANFPLYLIAENVNSATVKTQGIDFELNYGFDLAKIWEALPGSVTLRSLYSWQPYIKTTNLTGEPVTGAVMSRGRSTTFAQYTVGGWSLNVQNNWLSSFDQAAGNQSIIYVNPGRIIASFDTVDATISRKFEFDGHTVNLYLSVQNLANTQPPLYTTNNGGFAGGFYPAAYTESAIGRYVILGIRGRL
jgi:iron complex outermembrane receptor protein